MKRPFAVIGFTYISALFVAACFASTLPILKIVFLVLFIVSIFCEKSRNKFPIPVIFLTITIAFFVFNIFSNLENKISQKLVDCDATITGVVCEEPIESYGKYYYVIKTEQIFVENVANVPQNVKIRVSKAAAFDCDILDKITGKIHFYTKNSNGIFSSKNYYAARGIYNFAYFYDFEDYTILPSSKKSLHYYFVKFKQTLVTSLRNLLPKKYYSIASGILLGDKYFIDEEVLTDFKNIGVSHLLSVSGLHVSIISEFCLILFLAIKLSKRKTYFLTCLMILGFMALVGFTPSVVRAGIMLIIAHIGKLIFKSSDSLNSLGFATLVLSITNPFAGTDIGLILSISSTLGIILFSDKINLLILSKLNNKIYLNGTIKKLISSVSLTIAATLTTLPITIFYFNKFSFISLLSNLLMVLPSMVLLILSLVASFTNIFSFFRFISMPLGYFISIIVEYLINCAKILSNIPFASVSTAQPFLMFWAASMLVIFAVDLILNTGINIQKNSIFLSIVLLLIGILSYQFSTENIISLATVDVGTGCSAVLTKNGHAAVLACGGDEYKIKNLTTYLDNQNIKSLDFLVISDIKEKTSCYANDIINQYNPNYVILPNCANIDNRLSQTIADKSNLCYFLEKSTIKCWDNIDILVKNLGEQSFIYLTINNVTVLICPSGGDMAYTPTEQKSCYIFIEGVYPEKIDLINSVYMIMSNTSNLVNSKIKNVVKSNKIPIATAGDGNIIVDFTQNNTVSFRRVKV